MPYYLYDEFLPPPGKQKKWRRLAVYLLAAAVIQFSAFFAVDQFLQQRNSIDLEPNIVTEVKERAITLSPPPDVPGAMAVSADHSKLALMDAGTLRIYDLTEGRETQEVSLEGAVPGALMWLPDRSRLIFALMGKKAIKQTVEIPAAPTSVMDETYSTETFRTTTVVRDGFEIALYSLDSTSGADPELIQTLRQPGNMPKKVHLNLSTYTNLLYVNWTQDNDENLVQIDIMKRIKDIHVPRGVMNRLVVTPKTGELWTEFSDAGTPVIYKLVKNRWQAQKHLDGYRLLGATPEDMLVVAPDPAGNDRAKEISLVNADGEINPGWAFSSPLQLSEVQILKDGRLLYIDQDQAFIHTPQLGSGTVFDMAKVDAYSPDGKVLVSLQGNRSDLTVMEEVTGSAGDSDDSDKTGK